MEILKLSPACKDYLWGGDKLKKFFNKKCDTEILAETWELSCHKDGNSVIENGEYKGKTLSEYIERENKKPLGTNCERFENFPILIKFIDSRQPLSLQVHPDDKYALENEGQYGKTEMWYIIDCEENSFLYYGFKNPISKEEFQKHIEEGTLEDVLNKVKVKKGDVFFIESKTIHAIGSGITIAEIQQNSNVTYRVYDYNRVGADGKKRELHIDKAVDVTNLEFTGKNYNFGGHTVSCDIFEVDEFDVSSENLVNIADEKSFHSIIVIEGSGKVECNGNTMELKKGDSIFIPAGMGEYTISGELKVIKTVIPEKMKYTVGVDIGGTDIKVGILDKYNNFVSKGIYPTHSEKGWEEVVKNIIFAVNEILENSRIDKKDCEYIGIGCPGTIDPKSGVVVYSNNLKWENVNLKAEIEKATDMKVYISNDANCAALGEVKAGFGGKYKNAVVITLGTGVGGGIVIDGKIFEGGIGGAEIGHTLIERNGELCSCGRKGCLEAYASATALIRQSKEAANMNKESQLYKMCNGNIDNMNGKIPFDAAKTGDETALKVIDKYIDYLAEGIVDIINIFRPEAVILSGGISKQGEYLTDILKEKVMPNVFGGANSYIPEIRCAVLENDAGIAGAANLKK